MAFVPEDGTGLTNSNSYVTVAEFKTYWADRGFDTADYSDGDIQVALIKATDYIELQYRTRFLGYREVEGQALSFPRLGVVLYCVPVEGVPAQLKTATHEYGKRALTTELLPDPTAIDKTGQIISESKVKIGPIQKDIKYASIGAETSIPYPTADGWLKELLCSGGGVIRA